MTRFLCFLAASALLSGPAFATNYGNYDICSGDTQEGRATLVTPDGIEFLEGGCTFIGKPNYSGKPIKMDCSGEGYQWSATLELRLLKNGKLSMTKPSERLEFKGDGTNDILDVSAPKPAETVTLSACS